MGGSDRYGYRTTGWMGKTRRDSDLNSTGTHKYRGLTSMGLFSLGFTLPRVSRSLSAFYRSPTVNDPRNSKERKGKKSRKKDATTSTTENKKLFIGSLISIFIDALREKNNSSECVTRIDHPTIQIAKRSTVSRPSHAIRLGTCDSKLS